MAAILDFTRERGFPQGRFGWGFMGVITWPHMAVGKPFLTFLSIKKYLLPGLNVLFVIRSKILTPLYPN